MRCKCCNSHKIKRRSLWGRIFCEVSSLDVLQLRKADVDGPGKLSLQKRVGIRLVIVEIWHVRAPSVAGSASSVATCAPAPATGPQSTGASDRRQPAYQPTIGATYSRR